jgi:hypothetical protein
MMPAQYGGSELGLAEATVMMQTIAEAGGGYTASSCVHMNIFGLAPVVKYGTEEQKQRFLPPLIAGDEKACFAVTEPNTGLDTLKLQSLATRDGSDYVLKGSKIWTSTAQVAEKILILVRTTPLEEVKKPSEGLTLFYTDLDRSQVSVTEIKKMGRAAVDTNSLYFRLARACSRPHRSRRRWLQTDLARHECGAYLAVGRGGGDRLRGSATCYSVCKGTSGFRTPDRSESGHSTSSRQGLVSVGEHAIDDHAGGEDVG